MSNESGFSWYIRLKSRTILSTLLKSSRFGSNFGTPPPHKKQSLVVTNNFLPSQKVFATPARGFASAKYSCVFCGQAFNMRRRAYCRTTLPRGCASAQQRSGSHTIRKSAAGQIFLYSVRGGGLEPPTLPTSRGCSTN